MNSVKPDNEHGSAAPPADPHRPPPTTDERGFLACQAADAKTVMRRALGEMTATLGRIGHVRRRTRRHPWLMTGSALAGGFVAAALLTPTSARRKARANAADAAPEPAPCQPEKTAPRATRTLLVSSLGVVISDVLRTFARDFATTAIHARNAPHPESPSPRRATDAAAEHGNGWRDGT